MLVSSQTLSSPTFYLSRVFSVASFLVVLHNRWALAWKFSVLAYISEDEFHLYRMHISQVFLLDGIALIMNQSAGLTKCMDKLIISWLDVKPILTVLTGSMSPWRRQKKLKSWTLWRLISHDLPHLVFSVWLLSCPTARYILSGFQYVLVIIHW